MTRLAPACQHWRTTSATTSGLVLAACSGVRSQAMFGLMTTTSWRLTKRPMPPRSSRACWTSARGSPPCTTVRSAGSWESAARAMIAARLLGRVGNGTGAVLAEPDGRARRARRRAAHAQQLQHGFAPRHLLAVARCAVAFAAHGSLPVKPVADECALDRWCRAGAWHRPRWQCSVADGRQLQPLTIRLRRACFSIICNAV